MARLTIATSDIGGAGTDSTITAIIAGTGGYSMSFINWLDNPGDDFERGSIGVYDINLKGVKDVKTILLNNEASGSGPDWHVAWVHVEDSSIGLAVGATVNRWIEGGIQMLIPLYPIAQTEIVIPSVILARTPRPAVLRAQGITHG
ncbi:MAG: hypothetical protein F6J87_14430 [Spirulina sp. SIO3F2]|nr:hypothetical protein [Spirulina sp. SIO3F2]